MAAANDPTRLYRAKTPVRRSAGTICGTIACSIGRKGAVSEAEVPSVPKKPSSQQARVTGDQSEYRPGQSHQPSQNSECPAPTSTIGVEGDQVRAEEIADQ